MGHFLHIFHSFNNFIEHLLSEEQNERSYEVAKDGSEGILYLPQISVVSSG